MITERNNLKKRQGVKFRYKDTNYKSGDKVEYNGYKVNKGYFGSYCMDGLAIALHCCYNTGTVLEAIEKCVNYLGDADTTGSITGQIAGAFYGYKQIINDNIGKQIVNDINTHAKVSEKDDRNLIILRAQELFNLGSS